jgi:acyl-CoA thioesterase-1
LIIHQRFATQIRQFGDAWDTAGPDPCNKTAAACVMAERLSQPDTTPIDSAMLQHRLSSFATLAACLLCALSIHAGELFIQHSEGTPRPDPRAADDLKLPRVLVIGDSISMNYHEAAKAALAGVANYHRNEGNAASSAQGVRNMELWLGNYREKAWDVIQFNHGLHDLKQPYDANTDSWGDYTVSLADYKANLEKEIAILRKTGARLIWCSTTPVPNDNPSAYARRKGASKIFNDAALEVMRRHPDILITDLHAVVDGSPVFDNWRTGKDVHFYQKEEQKLLGEAVAATLRKALDKAATT